jgi:hypothetical protein
LDPLEMSDDQNRRLSDYREAVEARGLVPCPRCGTMVPGYAARCPECGVHFRGEAYDFAPDDFRLPHGIRRLARPAVVVIVLILMILLLISLTGHIW